MTNSANSVYQSGQKAPIKGWYEAVGVRQIAREFDNGELFPNFDGRAICWHLIDTEKIPTDAANRRAGAGTQISTQSYF